MGSLSRSASQEAPSRPDTSQRFAAVRMPLEEPVDDFEEAVQELQQCPSTELRDARDRHRRALAALRDEGYNGLSDATREHLEGHLRTNLKALNRALDRVSPDETEAPTDPVEENGDSFYSRLRTFFQTLW